MSKTLPEFLGGVIAQSTTLHGNLSDMLLAQGFQDLTGQVIDRVINLVQEMESNLVEMIRVTGQRMGTLAEPEKKKSIEAEGPQIDPTKDGVAANQDEVDQLLASLGF
jgi:chemotaxis protein CheZ